MVPTLFVVFLSLYEVAVSSNNGPRAVSTLDFVIMVGKHGARAPTHTYPRDPYRNKSFWPEGPGHVTTVGKYQMYKLGQRVRHLYNGFLSPMYHGSQLVAQSTLVDRTMISAATLLAGLYPPWGNQIWHPNITWLPIPIYPNLLDKSLLILEPQHCPRFWREQNVSMAKLPVEEEALQDVYVAMSEGTGRNITSLSQMYLLCHNLAAVAEHDLPLPKWAEGVFLSKILPVISLMVRHTTMRNVKMLKILNGPFLDKMLEMLQGRPTLKTGEHRQAQLKMLIHVGHDVTILSLLAAMGFKQEIIPWASTTLIFELHHNPALPSEYQLQVLRTDWRGNVSGIPEVLDLPICQSPCDLTTFVEATRKYTTKDWKHECLDMIPGDYPGDNQ